MGEQARSPKEAQIVQPNQALLDLSGRLLGETEGHPYSLTYLSRCVRSRAELEDEAGTVIEEMDSVFAGLEDDDTIRDAGHVQAGTMLRMANLAPGLGPRFGSLASQMYQVYTASSR
jgi:hypothetical protein